MTKTTFLDSAREVLEIEADAIKIQLKTLDRNFEAACQAILNCDAVSYTHLTLPTIYSV